ncbi:MAG: methyltransferase type 12 [Parcubacteria group bacterium]|nr:methyltransferase type 12 [Parcubacteria group bacterium]
MAAAYYNTPAGIHLAKREEPLSSHEFYGLCPLMGQNPLLLDVGCGLGRAVDAIKALGVTRYIGVDASEAMVDIARARYPEEDFRVGSFYDLGACVQEKCDAFVALHSLLHVPRGHMKYVLRSIRSVLGEGAVGLIMVPHGEAIKLFGHDYYDPHAPDELKGLPEGMVVLASAWSLRLLLPDLAQSGFAMMPQTRTDIDDSYLDLFVRAI